MTAYARTDDHQPLIEMNTTPLIDVMLVLLIMFIITIPIQTHATKIDSPADGHAVDREKNKIVIEENGTVRWNGEPVGPVRLDGLLAGSVALDPDPELHVQPDAAAPYARVSEVLAATKRAGVEHMGFVGNEQYRRF